MSSENLTPFLSRKIRTRMHFSSPQRHHSLALSSRERANLNLSPLSKSTPLPPRRDPNPKVEHLSSTCRTRGATSSAAIVGANATRRTTTTGLLPQHSQTIRRPGGTSRGNGEATNPTLRGRTASPKSKEFEQKRKDSILSSGKCHFSLPKSAGSGPRFTRNFMTSDKREEPSETLKSVIQPLSPSRLASSSRRTPAARMIKRETSAAPVSHSLASKPLLGGVLKYTSSTESSNRNPSVSFESPVKTSPASFKSNQFRTQRSEHIAAVQSRRAVLKRVDSEAKTTRLSSPLKKSGKSVSTDRTPPVKPPTTPALGSGLPKKGSPPIVNGRLRQPSESRARRRNPYEKPEEPLPMSKNFSVVQVVRLSIEQSKRLNHHSDGNRSLELTVDSQVMPRHHRRTSIAACCPSKDSSTLERKKKLNRRLPSLTLASPAHGGKTGRRKKGTFRYGRSSFSSTSSDSVFLSFKPTDLRARNSTSGKPQHVQSLACIMNGLGDARKLPLKSALRSSSCHSSTQGFPTKSAIKQTSPSPPEELSSSSTKKIKSFPSRVEPEHMGLLLPSNENTPSKTRIPHFSSSDSSNEPLVFYPPSSTPFHKSMRNRSTSTLASCRREPIPTQQKADLPDSGKTRLPSSGVVGRDLLVRKKKKQTSETKPLSQSDFLELRPHSSTPPAAVSSGSRGSKENEEGSRRSRRDSADFSRSKFSREGFIKTLDGPLSTFYDIDPDTLGEGTYGSVCKGVHKETGSLRAIKTIHKSKVKNAERFRQEIEIMKTLDHPNVIKLFETYEDVSFTFLVLELCSGGELFDRIIEQGSFSEEVAARLMKQIFSAIFYLHSQKIVHRDLKPENFLFLDKTNASPLKIIDFGLASRCDDTTILTTKAGTPYYVAPQVLRGVYTNKCDVWSAGVIMFILLCGYPPFHGETDAEILQKVKTAELEFNPIDWSEVSLDAQELIRDLLKYDPEERCTAEDALSHQWVKKWAAETAPASSMLSDTIVGNFKIFRAQSKLKRAAITFIAKQLDEEKISTLKETFLALDSDGDGSLSISEIRKGLRTANFEPLDVEKLLVELDSDGSGSIDYTEFLAAALDQQFYQEETACRQAFQLFDVDGNGRISATELLQVFHSHQPELSASAEADMKKLIEDVDENGDGEVDFDEFLHMMHNVPSSSGELAVS